MADINSTQNVSIFNDDGTDKAGVTNSRLDVNAQITGIGSDVRYDEPIYEYDGINTDRNKISYTVPTGKVLYLVTLGCSLMEGKIHVEWQEDGTGFAAIGLNEDGTTTAQLNTQTVTPWGPFAAGTVIRARREYGDSGKDWSAEMVGYLEDE